MHQNRKPDDRTRRTAPPAAGRADRSIPRTGLPALQATAGNHAVQRRLTQAREAGDADHEQRAALQRRLIDRALASPGAQIEDSRRQELEAFHGADLSTVSVHTGPAAEISAAAIGARAYTVDEHIVLGARADDDETIGHETRHVLQRRAGAVTGVDNGAGLRISEPGDRDERVADAAGVGFRRWVRGARTAERRGAVPEAVEVHRAVGGGTAASLSVQRVSSSGTSQPAEGTSPQSEAEAFEASLLACNDQERALSRKYGTRIGPAPDDPRPRHFSSAMLRRIDAALGQLPVGDVRDNPALVALEVDESADGNASAYAEDTGTIGFVRPQILAGFRAPQWLYSVFDMDSRRQRSRMDQGALASYRGVDDDNDRGLGIDPGSRQVMAPQGNLVKWTTRHEVGHAVDKNSDVVARFSAQEEFGGWRIHQNAADRDPIAEMVLDEAGFADARPAQRATDVGTLASHLAAQTLLNPEHAERRALYFERFRTHFTDPGAFEVAKTRALTLMGTMAAQPWTLPDDQLERLAHEGRAYHISPYEKWVSYSLAQRRQYKVSNYQYSDPAEWFSEVYSAYYNTNRPELRNKIHPAVRAWLETRDEGS